MSSRLLPPNSTPYERAIADTLGQRLDPLAPEIISAQWRPTSCPPALLPWLAWTLSVDEWDDRWDETTKRRVIGASVEQHRKKGTVASVKRALENIGYNNQLIEWWQSTPVGNPHTFGVQITIDENGIDAAGIASIDHQLAATKPARSHYTLTLIGHTRCAIRHANATQTGDIVTVQPAVTTEITAPVQSLKAGIGLQDWGSISIYPRTH